MGAMCRSTRPGKSSPAAGATRWLATMPGISSAAAKPRLTTRATRNFCSVAAACAMTHPRCTATARGAIWPSPRPRYPARTASPPASWWPSWTSVNFARPSAPRVKRATRPKKRRAPRPSSWPTSATNCARRCSPSSAFRNWAWCAQAHNPSWAACSGTSMPPASACWHWSTTCWTSPRSKARWARSTWSAPMCARWSAM